MKTLYDVRADHPIGKRIDELRLTAQEKNDLVAELETAGYEFKDIAVESHNYYEAGDEIKITAQDMIRLMENDEFYRTINHIIEQKAKNKGLDLVTTSKDNLFPLTGTLKSMRVNRTFGHLIIEWDIGDDPDGMWKQTNVYFMEKMGYRFIQPEFDEIPLIQANDDILHEHELVIKHYALQNKISVEEAKEAIGKVTSAMGVNGIVFYRP